ncbi:MAG: TonB-dependent receptor [bacterium]
MSRVSNRFAACRPVFVLIVAIVSFLDIAFAAEKGEVRGVVRNRESSNPLPGANVWLEGTTLGTTTDLEGRYLISRVPAGTYFLRVTYVGYKQFRIQVMIQAEEATKQDAKLLPENLEGQEVTVTAQREGQVEAINRQLSSNTIVNVVSAERIQELPDVNAAESVGRLPGVSVMREGGEGQKVVIRGLAPTYNSVTIGGTKIPSSDLEDRSIDLSMISSDMLAGIEVTKAITPDKDADAFGGIVDFQIAKAPEGGFKGNLRIQNGYSDLLSEYGQFKNTFKLNQRFFGDQLGVIVTGNLERANRSADIYNAGYSIEREARPGEEFAPIRIDDLTLEDRVETLKRYGGNLMLDYRFDRGEIQFNNFLNRVDREQTANEQQMDPQINNDLSYNLIVRDISKEIVSSSLNGKYRIPFATMDAGIAYSQAVQLHPHDLEFQFVENAAFDQVIYNQNKRTLGPDAILLAKKNNFRNAGINEGILTTEESKESDLTSRLNLEVPFNFFGKKTAGALKLGGKITSKTRAVDQSEFFQRLYQETQHWDDYRRLHTQNGTPGFSYQSILTSNMPSLINYVDPNYDAGNFLNGEYEFNVGLNRGELMHLARMYLIDSVFTQDELSGLDDFSSTEQVAAGYVMAEINLGRRFMILPGVRYEHTYVKMASKSSNIREGDIAREGSVSDTTANHQYGDWFPMLHLRYRVTDWFDIRLAGTRSLSRARLDYLNPREKKRTSSATISRGIIDLKPQISTNYDLFLSFHSYRLGLFTLGGFYKNIEDLIWLRNNMTIYRADVLAGNYPPEYRGNALTQPENNPFDTEVKGFEVEWQTNFSWLPRPLAGLVLNVNYSHIWSETRYPFSINQTLLVPPFTSTRIDSFRVGPMPNQSDNIANVAIGYDLGGFSTRVSALYQGRTLSSVGNRKEVDGFTDTLVRWDLLAKFKITKWLSIYGNWNNLTNSADQSFIQAEQYADEKEFYGWTADAGLVFDF